MALRNCLLLCFYFLQNLSVRFPHANHGQKTPYMDVVHRDGAHGPCRPRLHVFDAITMQAAQLFLDSLGI